MMDQEQARSLFDVFALSQETFEEAKKKSSDESSKRANYFRFAKDGTYSIRILPLAPVQDKDGQFLPLERKGYEYPLRSLMLKIEHPSKMAKDKPQITYVSVCNAKYAFPSLETDLVDTYVRVACEKYADDEKLCKKLREGSFSGGLKWDARRCMYIIDLEKPGDGIQILQLSYSQYKDLEERKLNLWAKLNKNGRNVPCPISSIDAAYPVEVIRKTENGKASYSFNIDTVAEKDVLEETTLQRLLDTPRLPDQIYRYTRYHLEATIVFLNQLDEKYDIDVMTTNEVQDCIAKIKMLLPADDNSHFNINNAKGSEDANEEANSIDALWERYDKLEAEGLDDQTTEGQDLRSSILAFIQANDLDVKVTRKKKNLDILNEIEEELNNADSSDQDDEEGEPEKKQNAVDFDDVEDDEPATPAEEDDDEPAAPAASRRRERDDDTSEPAAQSDRRNRPVHHRRRV